MAYEIVTYLEEISRKDITVAGVVFANGELKEPFYHHWITQLSYFGKKHSFYLIGWIAQGHYRSQGGPIEEGPVHLPQLQAWSLWYGQGISERKMRVVQASEAM